MNAAIRDVEAGLRRARAERAFGAAVAPLREWSSDMADIAALCPETAAIPMVPDVRGLVDPLADSALATASLYPLPAKGDAPDAPGSRGHARSSIPEPRRRAWIAARSAAESGTAAASASLRKGATCDPAQVESLLVGHRSPGAGLMDPGTVRGQWETTLPSAPNVVYFSSWQPVGEAAAQVETMRSSRTMASTIARWTELMTPSVTGHGKVPARGDVGAERPPWSRQPRLSPDARSVAGAAFDAATLAAHAFTAAEPTHPDVMLRLCDLTDPNPSHRPNPVDQPAAIPGTGALHDSSSASAAERGSLGRVFDSLARIEQQVAARASSHAEPMTQWYDDDDGLAGRIHDILRRQVERHGINLA